MNMTVCSVHLDGDHQIELVQGNITEEHVDAIVNAANTYLVHGGGVAGAIVRAGGLTIQQQSSEWVRVHGPVSHRSPAYTRGGNMPCHYVIHAVGPIWGEGGETHKLSDAVLGSLELGEKMGLASLAFPAISTGIYQFPVPLAAKVILQSIHQYFMAAPQSNLKRIRIVLLDDMTFHDFEPAFYAEFHSEIQQSDPSDTHS
jgi:O-acetyl-ADP-ribose deacetylase (regulator of RNase III)